MVTATDTTAGTMVVEFDNGGAKTSLNLPLPPVEHSLEAWVALYAPPPKTEIADVQVGMSGSIEAQAEVQTETPNTVGSWNEEYLRAMIYQVLEEIRESEV